MHMETKYLRLPTPVTLGSRFDNWRVCWLGGWSKHRMFYLVMLVRVLPDRPAPGCERFGTAILPKGGS
jgi:hypothetical protein